MWRISHITLLYNGHMGLEGTMALIMGAWVLEVWSLKSTPGCLTGTRALEVGYDGYTGFGGVEVTTYTLVLPGTWVGRVHGFWKYGGLKNHLVYNGCTGFGGVEVTTYYTLLSNGYLGFGGI